MHARDIFTPRKPTVSFEFFPPKSSEAQENLFATILDLETIQPAFVSVTYGAGGSTRELTHDLVLRLKKQTSLNPVPHLTCVGHTEAEIHAILERYAAAGVSNILALRGDPPRDQSDYDHSRDTFPQAADLVRFIKKFSGHPDPRGFGIGVAGFPEGHPSTPNRLLDYICTQLFFENRDFYDFRERCDLAGIHIPIVAGIMPVTSLSSMKRMAELAGGARYPARLLKALQRAGDSPEAVRQIGLHYATEQCADLLDNSVSGIHLYTLNQSTATREICQRLGVTK